MQKRMFAITDIGKPNILSNCILFSDHHSVATLVIVIQTIMF